jgi:hypothetical protein
MQGCSTALDFRLHTEKGLAHKGFWQFMLNIGKTYSQLCIGFPPCHCQTWQSPDFENFIELGTVNEGCQRLKSA